MKKVTKIRDRMTRKPGSFPVYLFKGKSLTIPGQALTVQEILRNFVRPAAGLESSSGFFPELELERLRSMDEMDRLDYLRQLRSQQADLREELQKIAQVQYDAEVAKQSLKNKPTTEVVKDAGASTDAPK